MTERQPSLCPPWRWVLSELPERCPVPLAGGAGGRPSPARSRTLGAGTSLWSPRQDTGRAVGALTRARTCVRSTIFQNIILIGEVSMEDLLYFPAYLMLHEGCSFPSDRSFTTLLVKEMFLSLARCFLKSFPYLYFLPTVT